ncbi:CDGSH iron-sulfur domain-containing protein [Acetobacterium tundrae]|uniref:Iron-binding protein n=1 Tax=Acetobacterium tundrae TaxID=132932 RepID=A0ABR6WR48_9FIRM|nr:CDGSH iron-sulfur domain-containing protein [Acetobacterium tundrae]MBC3798640.1 iron-binding protein [Acetobacterium tundrae]
MEVIAAKASNEKQGYKIKITENGPYIVSGNVPLSEKIIVPKGKSYEFKEGRELPQSEEYVLCRCGKSQNAPFCDGTHSKIGFVGTETASKKKYEDRAELRGGPAVDLLDDHRCASARFCHRETGDAWELTRASDNEANRKEAMQAAKECPSGRITAIIKTGEIIEPELEPSIEIVQDPEKGVSAGIFVKGNIPIESADAQIYQIRNRVALSRCGQSENKPFCDARHTSIEYFDRKGNIK